MRDAGDLISRRHAVAAATSLLLLQPSLPLVRNLALPPCSAADKLPGPSAERLLSLIPSMPYGAPATNATLPPELVSQIESAAEGLERLGARDLARAPMLSGSWRLLYSNGREITNLATNLPLGFALGETYQPLDVATGRFENRGTIVQKLGLARASTCVVGDVRLAPAGTLNAAGTLNDRGNRVDVDFRRLVFSLDELAGRPAALRKIIVPRNDPSAAQPANDVTYLDGDLRVTRGGDDGLFIFRREESGTPLLTANQREELYAEGGADVVTGKGVATDGAPPELRRLLQK